MDHCDTPARADEVDIAFGDLVDIAFGDLVAGADTHYDTLAGGVLHHTSWDHNHYYVVPNAKIGCNHHCPLSPPRH